MQNFTVIILSKFGITGNWYLHQNYHYHYEWKLAVGWPLRTVWGQLLGPPSYSEETFSIMVGPKFIQLTSQADSSLLSPTGSCSWVHLIKMISDLYIYFAEVTNYILIGLDFGYFRVQKINTYIGQPWPSLWVFWSKFSMLLLDLTMFCPFPLGSPVTYRQHVTIWVRINLISHANLAVHAPLRHMTEKTSKYYIAYATFVPNSQGLWEWLTRKNGQQAVTRELVGKITSSS